MFRKIYNLINDEELGVRERLFRVILLVGTLVTLIAIVAGIAMENVWFNTLPLLILLGAMGIALLATFKYRRLEFSAVMIGVLIIVVIFPMVFFMGGGIHGGATVWFVLGILYIFLMFSGKSLIVFLCLAVVADAATYIVAYYHEDWITPLASNFETYYDSLFAVLTVGIAIGYIMHYQVKIFEREREVTLAQKHELEQVGRSRNSFFANISHEIRTPINTIIGLNEMILREDVSNEVREDAVNIQKASKMLLVLINDILDISKIESRRMEIVPGRYDTKEMFSELLSLVRISAAEKNLELIVDIDETLPAVLFGDEKRIKQVMLNILTNAVKYTKEGSITLSATGEVLDTGTIKLKMSVADTGAGIKEEDMENLFKSFQRVDLEKNHKIEGTGLGLSISKQLVDLMGGTITVDSIYMKGSTFTVMLEQHIMDTAPMGKFDTTVAIPSGEYYHQSFEAPEARILIVDDNEQNLLVGRKLLRDTKMQIDTALGGRKCLECTKMKYYHLILMDYMMPELDGVQTLRAIRTQENGLCRESPVIALTAASGEGQAYADYGFSGFLAKPIDGRKLEMEIRKFLPGDIVEIESEQNEQMQDSRVTSMITKRKRRKILVTTDCSSDLPKDLQEKYDIRVMYLYVATDKGTFRDTKEIDSNNLSHYLSSSNSTIYAVSAPIEEYEAFYAEMLTEAEEVVHISLAKNAGKSYETAKQAARGFGHVHVIDSGYISGGEGLVVLCAARMAREGATVEEICEKIEWLQGKIEISFLLPTVKIFWKNGYTDQITGKILEQLGLHPILHMHGGSLRVCGAVGGRIEVVRRRYIRSRLRRKWSINKDIVFVTYVGCTKKQQEEIQEEILKCVPFKRVIMQKASVTNGCNAGLGTIGISYMKKIRPKNQLDKIVD